MLQEWQNGLYFVRRSPVHSLFEQTMIRADILLGSLRFLGKFPLKHHYKFSKIFSWLLSSVMHYRKDVVYINLSRAFPELSCQEIDQLARDFYLHFGEIISEAIWFAGSTPAKIRKEDICTIINPEVLAKAYDKASNVMILTSHTGNWELTGGLRYYNPKPELDYVFNENHISIVYKQQSSKVWDEVLKKTRSTPVENYQGLVESKQILRYALEHSQSKKIYIFINDQRPYGTGTEIGEFMHQKTSGMAASIKLASKLHMSVLFSKMVRTRQGHYEITYVPLADDAHEYQTETLLKKYFDELEKELHQTPANYLWSHKRWK